MLCYAFYVCFVWLKTMIMSDFKDSIHYNAKQAILIFEKMKLLIIAALNGAIQEHKNSVPTIPTGTIQDLINKSSLSCRHTCNSFLFVFDNFLILGCVITAHYQACISLKEVGVRDIFEVRTTVCKEQMG